MHIGSRTELKIPGGELGHDVPVQLWSPHGISSTQELPLLVANDGAEYDERSNLIGLCSGLIESGALPPHRVALVDPAPGCRDNWYSGSPAYDRVMAEVIVPTITEEFPTTEEIIGLGGSMGAAAMLGCALRHPGTFARLFMQSGSFHHNSLEDDPNSYPFLWQVKKLMAEVMDTPVPGSTMDIMITCSREEGNLQCNRRMAQVLRWQGHHVTFEPVWGSHGFEAWGEALPFHLPAFLRDCREAHVDVQRAA